MHNPQHLCGRAGTSGARRARAEGEGLSHRGWRVPPGWPEWGALASLLRVRVMQTHEGREGVGGGGQAAESQSGRARVCVRGSQVMDAPQRTAATPWGGGGQRTAAAAAPAARKAPQGRGCGRASGSAVRRSAGKAPQLPGAARETKRMGRLLRRQDRDALMVSSLAGPPFPPA